MMKGPKDGGDQAPTGAPNILMTNMLMPSKRPQEWFSNKHRKVLEDPVNAVNAHAAEPLQYGGPPHPTTSINLPPQ